MDGPRHERPSPRTAVQGRARSDGPWAALRGRQSQCMSVEGRTPIYGPRAAVREWQSPRTA